MSSQSLILVGHGSSVNAESSAPTLAHAEALRKTGRFREVISAFWKESPSMREALEMVSAENIYIVPNFISEGYFTQTVIPREFGLAGPLTPWKGKLLKYCQPVGNHPRMTDLLLRRAREIAPGVPPSSTSLVIVGHGTGKNQNSALAAIREADRIRERNLYAEVLSAYMEQAPFIAEWDQLTSQPSVVVVPFFIADGLHSFEDIPVLMGLEAGQHGSVFSQNPYRIRGRDLYYSSAIGTEPGFAELLLDQVDLFDRQHASVAGAPEL